MKLTRHNMRVMRPFRAGAWILVIAILHTTTINAQSQVGAVAGAVAAAAAGEADQSTPVSLVVGRSMVLNTTSPITRVSLTSADIADALVTSTTQLLLHGKAPGTITMFVWNRSGAVQRYEVNVARDIARLATQVQELFPNEKIEVRSNGRDIVLAGTVSSKEIAEKAVGLSAGFVEKREDVVNLLQVAAPRTNQVLLRVRFAEVSRSALTELGLSLFTSATGINNTLGRVTTQQFPGGPGYTDLNWTKTDNSFGSDVTESSGKITFSDFLNLFVLSEKYDLGVLIKALSQRGLFQSLAEPNLVAESGKEATFLAGGEFPIPVAQGTGANTSISVQFKEFGIRLGFTPIVDGDRVHLKVAPEVSSLDFSNAVVTNGFRIPALTTRRTATELELRDGQTFAIAGLLNNTMNSTLQKIPGIGDIPILGYLFRSKAAQKNRTELVVMITPQILREGSPGVTDALPKLAEPFMSGLEDRKSIAPPPPAFAGASMAPSSPAATAAAPVVAPAAPVMTAVVPVAPTAAGPTLAPAASMAPASATPVMPTPVAASPAAAIVPEPAAATPEAAAPVVPATTDPVPATVPDSTLVPVFIEPAPTAPSEPAAAPAPATAPAPDAPPASTAAETDPKTEAKLREEQRLQEVRLLAAEARKQALTEPGRAAEEQK